MSTDAELAKCIALAKEHLEVEHKNASLDCKLCAFAYVIVKLQERQIQDWAIISELKARTQYLESNLIDTRRYCPHGNIADNSGMGEKCGECLMSAMKR